MLDRANHRSASSEPEKTSAALSKEVKQGFSLPLPVSSVKRLKGAMVQPCGLAHQMTLQADGTRAKKSRLTHDLSFSLSKPTASVNSRIKMNECPEMTFGWCFDGTLHYISAPRLQHPNQRMLLAKYDFSDAYRRIMHSPSAAAQSTLVWQDVACLALRLGPSYDEEPGPTQHSGTHSVS